MAQEAVNAVCEVIGLPSAVQRAWLVRGLDQPGGKLPLFDRNGQQISPRTVKTCLDRGWAEPWFSNPLKPDWLVCKLTPTGRRMAERDRRPPATPEIKAVAAARD